MTQTLVTDRLSLVVVHVNDCDVTFWRNSHILLGMMRGADIKRWGHHIWLKPRTSFLVDPKKKIGCLPVQIGCDSCKRTLLVEYAKYGIRFSRKNTMSYIPIHYIKCCPQKLRAKTRRFLYNLRCRPDLFRPNWRITDLHFRTCNVVWRYRLGKRDFFCGCVHIFLFVLIFVLCHNVIGKRSSRTRVFFWNESHSLITTTRTPL